MKLNNRQNLTNTGNGRRDWVVNRLQNKPVNGPGRYVPKPTQIQDTVTISAEAAGTFGPNNNNVFNPELVGP